MPTYTSAAILQPFLPKNLLTPTDVELLQKCGFSHEETEVGKTKEPALYFFASEYAPEAFTGCDQTDVITVEEILQQIIVNSEGKIPWISLEFSHKCSKMAPDGFGGSAMLVTADDVEEFSTTQWLQEKFDSMHCN